MSVKIDPTFRLNFIKEENNMSTMEELAVALRGLQALVTSDRVSSERIKERMAEINNFVKLIVDAARVHGVETLAAELNRHSWESIVPAEGDYEGVSQVNHTLIETLCDIRAVAFERSQRASASAALYKSVSAFTLSVLHELFSHFSRKIAVHDAKIAPHSESFTQPLVYAIDADDLDLAKTLVSQIGCFIPSAYAEYIKDMEGESGYKKALELYNYFHPKGSPSRITEASPAAGALASPFGG